MVYEVVVFGLVREIIRVGIVEFIFFLELGVSEDMVFDFLLKIGGIVLGVVVLVFVLGLVINKVVILGILGVIFGVVMVILVVFVLVILLEVMR